MIILRCYIITPHVLEGNVSGVLTYDVWGKTMVDNKEKLNWFWTYILEMVWLDDFWVCKRKFEFVVLEDGSTMIVDLGKEFFSRRIIYFELSFFYDHIGRKSSVTYRDW